MSKKDCCLLLGLAMIAIPTVIIVGWLIIDPFKTASKGAIGVVFGLLYLAVALSLVKIGMGRC